MNNFINSYTNRSLQLPLLLLALALSNSASANFLSEAETYFKEGKYNYAVIQAKNALRENPNQAQARFLLGKSLLELGNFSSAEIELSKADSMGIPKDELAIPLARIDLAQKKYDAVISRLNHELLEKTDHQEQAYTALGYAYMGKNNLIEGKKLFEKSILLKESAPAYVGLARIALIDEKNSVAKFNLDKALKLEPDFIQALFLKGQLLDSENSLEEAELIFSEILDNQPKQVAAFLARSETRLKLNNLTEAASDANESLKLVPNHPTANYLLARIYLTEKKFKEAISRGEQAYKIEPKDPKNLFVLGTAHYAEGNMQQAKFYLEQLKELVPNHLESTKMLAAINLRIGNPEASISLLESLDDSNTQNDSQLLHILGQAYFKNGQFEQGNTALSKAKEIDPNLRGIDTQLAMGKIETGEIEDAARLLDIAFQKPDSPMTTGIMLVMLHIKNENWTKAESAINDGIKRFPKDGTFYHLHGLSEKKQGHKQAAKAAIKKSIEVDPNYIPAHVDLGNLDLEEGLYSSAKAQYERVLELEPNHLKSQLALAFISQKEGDKTGSLNRLKLVRSENPDSALPVIQLVNYYLENKEATKAVREAERFLSIKRNNATVLALLARANMATGRNDEAISNLHRLLEIKPEDLSARTQLIQLLASANKLEAAENEANLALDQVPNNLLIQTLKVAVLIKSQKWDSAEKLISNIQSQTPKSHLAEQLRGDLYLGKSDFENAITHYQTAFNIKPTPKLTDLIVGLHQKRGTPEKSIQTLSKYLQNNPEDNKRRFLLANIHQQLGSDALAIKHYELIRASQVDNPVVLNNLAWIYWMQKNPKGFEYAKQAYKLAPSNINVMDTYGWIMLHEGDPTQALAIIEKAASDAFFNPEIQYHRAVALKTNGKIETAKTVLKRITRDFSSSPSSKKAHKLLEELP